MRKLSAAFVVILIAASYAASIDQTNPNFSSPSMRTVSGTRIGHFTDGPVGEDLSLVRIAANVPNGTGGYTVIIGSGTSSGTFTIPNVPTGFYLLELGRLYLWTSNTVVDTDFAADYRQPLPPRIPIPR